MPQRRTPRLPVSAPVSQDGTLYDASYKSAYRATRTGGARSRPIRNGRPLGGGYTGTHAAEAQRARDVEAYLAGLRAMLAARRDREDGAR